MRTITPDADGRMVPHEALPPGGTCRLQLKREA
jgi:hypothetical protein